MSLTLIIANKTYSSWSLRPWILMRHFGIAFDEVVIPLAQDNTRAELLRFSPAGKCPSLRDGKITVWDSLAIIEYVAELHPTFANLAEAAGGAGAGAFARRRNAFGLHGLARAAADEHAPRGQKRELTPEASADVARLEQAFEQARG